MSCASTKTTIIRGSRSDIPSLPLELQGHTNRQPATQAAQGNRPLTMDVTPTHLRLPPRHKIRPLPKSRQAASQHHRDDATLPSGAAAPALCNLLEVAASTSTIPCRHGDTARQVNHHRVAKVMLSKTTPPGRESTRPSSSPAPIEARTWGFTRRA
jgi:hypothetical protein